MDGLMKRGGMKLAALVLIMGLGAMPAGATVPGDLAAGLPLEKVLINGLGAGLSIENVVTQALGAGAKYCPLVKVSLAQKLDLSQVFKAILDYYSPRLAKPKRERVTPCDLLKCAVENGADMVEAANALMAAGARLQAVRDCLQDLGFAGAQTYEYSGPMAPIDSGGGPNFPGGGIASPSS